MFRLVQSLISRSQNLGGCQAVVWENSHAHRKADRPQNLAGVLYVQLFDFFAQDLGSLESSIQRGIRQDECELFSAVTAGNVLPSSPLFQAVSQGTQQSIACLVAKYGD